MGIGCSLQVRAIGRGRGKKLRAGIGFSISLQDLNSSDYNCSDCSEKKRKDNNCHNREELKEEYSPKTEWVEGQPRGNPKTIDGKFFACPMSVITENTWSIIGLVNSTTDVDCNILHLPYPGSYLQQPKWYRDAVDITRNMRNEDRNKRAKAAAAKAKNTKR